MQVALAGRTLLVDVVGIEYGFYTLILRPRPSSSIQFKHQASWSGLLAFRSPGRGSFKVVSVRALDTSHEVRLLSVLVVGDQFGISPAPFID